ncbi:hypothetical protein [Segetibacter koreensis]|uniref:hypothetical protein n=1 Tax=Segetibacter koreensis TaxID=398037 RepID=UPI00037C5EF1|nr:hypothetical protein [Segetibacter koreensis]
MLSVIFYAWARPIEITRLTIGEFELSLELIRFKKGKTKNGEASYVQIVPPLKELIKKLNLQQYPGHYKVFSDNFQPGVRQVSKHYALKFWKKWVKDKQGINKDMYSLKHTGNIEYLLNNKENINLKWQQMQNRHSSATITERYNRKLGAYFIEVGNLNFRQFIWK